MTQALLSVLSLVAVVSWSLSCPDFIIPKISSVDSNFGYQVTAEYLLTVYRALAAVLLVKIVTMYIQFFELCRYTSAIQLLTQKGIKNNLHVGITPLFSQ